MAADRASRSARASQGRAVIPIWRRPWMVLGRDTFAGDVLARLGVANVYAGHAERYPKVPLDDLLAARPDLVVLPDEPYRFTAGDGPECFPGVPAALVSGRHLTWYGPSLAEAPRVLARPSWPMRPPFLPNDPSTAGRSAIDDHFPFHGIMGHIDHGRHPHFPRSVRLLGLFRPFRRTVRGKRGREGPV